KERTALEADLAKVGTQSAIARTRERVGLAFLGSVDYLEQVIGRFAETYGPRLERAAASKEDLNYREALERYNAALRDLIDGTDDPDKAVAELEAARKIIDDPSSTASRLYRTIGWIMTNLMSYEALRQTGLQTTWGLRTYIPGTFGIGGNVGPWLQTYS